MKYLLLLLTALVAACPAPAQQLRLIPYPDQVQLTAGTLPLPADVQFTTTNAGFRPLLEYLNAASGKGRAGRQQPVTLALTGGTAPAEGYRLSVTGRGIRIDAIDTAGLFNGLVTLWQLCKTSDNGRGQYLLPQVVIRDAPRYAWRGFMLDESRHFFGKATVESLLDWMAFYKLNRFHWHLTDAQGWRIAIDQYPLLASEGGRGNFTDPAAAAQYYTPQDIREIVAYAKARHIVVIPEIDMPGHATAATRAYPALSGGDAPDYNGFTFNPASDSTYTFITNVFTALLPLFPDHFVHIGGDEVALGIKAWAHNAAVQNMMQRLHFSDLDEVEHYFLRRVADSLVQRHATVLCWDEAVGAGLPPAHTLVTWWRQNKPETLTAAFSAGYPVILCPRLPLYFDFIQDSAHVSGRTWGTARRFNPYTAIYQFPDRQQDTLWASPPPVLGLQANLWTETVASVKRLQFLTFPRLAALAEAAWAQPGNKDEQAFGRRLQQHLPLYEAAGLYYYDPFDPGKHPEPVDVPVKRAVRD